MLTRRILIAFVLALPLLAAAEEPKAKPQRDPRTLRVMSYNIHVGKGVDGKLDLPRIAGIIKSADVDVVAIQEVDVKARRTDNVDEPAELARLTGMHAVFGKAIDHDGGDYGQVILSRQPIERLDVHKLPNEPGQEQRIALIAQIPQPRPLPDIMIIGTHLHAFKGDALRLAQATELNHILDKPLGNALPAPLLLGDLNATPDSSALKELGKHWVDASADSGPTIPAEKPNKKIDYVLLPKDHKWTVVTARVLDEPVASDHRPVVVELRWKGE